MNITPPRGTWFGRVVRSLAIAGGHPIDAQRFAESQDWADTPAVAQYLRAAVSAQSRDDFAMNPVAWDLAEYLRPLTILGRLANLRRVPFDVNLRLATAGAAAAFVAEGNPIPATDAGYSNDTLRGLKVGTVAVISKDLALNATPAATETIAAEVGHALAETMNTQFIDPTAAGLPDESPPSVTYGATQIASSGSTVAAIDAGLSALMTALIGAGMPLSTAAWIGHPQSFAAMGLMRGSGGDLAYPGVGPRGGVLCGLPAIASTACGGLGSPTSRFLALVEAGEILVADDGAARIETASAGALQMNTTPGSGAQNLTSLWQTGSIGIKAVRQVNWKRRRDGAVAVLTGVTF